MVSVAIVGGGIGGLSAAYHLTQKQIQMTLFEKASRPGGVVHSEQQDGYLVEHGPNAIEGLDPLTRAMIQDLHLEKYQVMVNPTARKLYIVRDGHLIKVPMSPRHFVSSPLFSLSGKIRLLQDLIIRKSDPQADPSIAEFIQRRLGNEFFNYIVSPFVTSVMAGDPSRLSMRHALPKFYASEQQYGSLIKGQFKQRRQNKKQLSPTAQEESHTFSFIDGMQMLTDALYQRIQDRVRLNTTVTHIHQTSSGWVVAATNNGQSTCEQFDAVIYAAPLHQLSSIDIKPALNVPLLTEVEYPPLSVFALGFLRDQIVHPLDGLGMLIPSIEESPILGTLFSSITYPHRAPDGKVLLTSFIGGATRPEMAMKTTEELLGIILHELQQKLGITGKHLFMKHIYLPYSIPQYNLGYRQIQMQQALLEERLQGFFLAGNYQNGISVREALRSGYEATRRLTTSEGKALQTQVTQ